MTPSRRASTARRRVRVASPLAGLMLLASLSASPRAFAQTATDSATAETLFNEALTLLESKTFAEACTKLEASQKLDPGVGTLLYLADCYEQLGRTASAWATFREAAYLAKDKADERESVAIDHARELEPRLSYLTVTVASPAAAGLELKHNGKPLGSALWGSAFPVDPGAHTIEASAPGKKVWSQTVNVVAGPRKELMLVPELLVAEPEPVVVKPAPPPRAPEGTGDTQSTVGWVLLGVGSAAVVTGGVFALLARSDDTSAAAQCRPDRIQLCSPAGVELGESAETKATLAGLSAGVGLAALGAGVTLLLTAPSDREPPRELRVQADVTDQRGFVSVTSTW